MYFLYISCENKNLFPLCVTEKQSFIFLIIRKRIIGSSRKNNKKYIIKKRFSKIMQNINYKFIFLKSVFVLFKHLYLNNLI